MTMDRLAENFFSRQNIDGDSVKILGEPIPGKPAELYVPSTERIRTELGAQMTVDLDESLRRTFAWYKT